MTADQIQEKLEALRRELGGWVHRFEGKHAVRLEFVIVVTKGPPADGAAGSLSASPAGKE